MLNKGCDQIPYSFLYSFKISQLKQALHPCRHRSWSENKKLPVERVSHPLRSNLRKKQFIQCQVRFKQQQLLLPIQQFIKVSIYSSETEPSYRISACFPPNITLFPALSEFDRPLQFRRSQDFYITAMLKLVCAESLAIETKWSIYNCTPNCSTRANIDASINTSFSEVYIPARTLVYGLYEFKLTVTMLAVPKMFARVSAFVKINPSGITANLVQFGTSMVTSGQERDLILDPGVFSINPDENTFNASVSVEICNSLSIFSLCRIGLMNISVDSTTQRIPHDGY